MSTNTVISDREISPRPTDLEYVPYIETGYITKILGQTEFVFILNSIFILNEFRS